MNHQPQQLEMPVYEHIYDALRACVQIIGGNKEVGKRLWPTKSPAQQHSDVTDCLNPNNARKFDPQETFKIFEWSKEKGFHAGLHYACHSIGYHPPAPISAQEQAEALADRFEAGLREMRSLTTQIERLNSSGVLRQLKSSSG